MLPFPDLVIVGANVIVLFHLPIHFKHVFHDEVWPSYNISKAHESSIHLITCFSLFSSAVSFVSLSLSLFLFRYLLSPSVFICLPLLFFVFLSTSFSPYYSLSLSPSLSLLFSVSLSPFGSLSPFLSLLLSLCVSFYVSCLSFFICLFVPLSLSPFYSLPL